jgi:hypothetical protein
MRANMVDFDANDAATEFAAHFYLSEQGQAALQTKFDTISNQLHLLLNALRGKVVPPNPPPPPFIRLKRLAGTAELCAHCSNEHLVTRVMACARDGESHRKLLSLSPFPTLQQAVKLCHGERSTRANKRTLSGQSSVKH